jgi:hypothetical protein
MNKCRAARVGRSAQEGKTMPTARGKPGHLLTVVARRLSTDYGKDNG